MEHIPIVSRFSRGRGRIKGAGVVYGTRIRCSCGDLNQTINEAPSKGGSNWAAVQHAKHAAETTWASDIVNLHRRVDSAVLKLCEVLVDGMPGEIKTWGREVADLSALLADEYHNAPDDEAEKAREALKREGAKSWPI